MSASVTFDDVWKMFQEMVRENRERSADLDRKFQETDRKFQETDRQFQETERQFQEATHEIRRENAIHMRETERVVKEVSRQIGQLGSRWGEFVEGLVAPACERLFNERNIPIHQVFQRVKAKLPGNRHMEIDLLAVNGEVAIPVEVKSRLRVEDVQDFMERLTTFKEFFPRYADCRIFAAVAAIVVEEGVDRLARKEGLFVIIQSGDTVRLDNPPDFIPRAW